MIAMQQAPKPIKDQQIIVRVSETEKEMLMQVAEKIKAKSLSDAVRKLARYELGRK